MRDEKFIAWMSSLRTKYAYDFRAWCKDIMGYGDLNAEHDALCKFMEEDYPFKLILMPRYTFKSCICTVGETLHDLMIDPNQRILIYSDATSKAQGFLTGIKNHIEGKAGKFRSYFGEWETDPKKGKWNEGEIIVSTRTEAYSEYSIETAGIETSKVGKHYDKIIFDDIVSDKNVTTKDQMDKVADCYYKALSLLRPGGKVVMLGCLVAGTKVLKADGTWEGIEKIEVGEYIITYDSLDWKVEEVKAMIPQGKAEVFELKTPNHTIEATSNHPFLKSDGEFVQLRDLNIGDTILSYGKKDYGEVYRDYTKRDYWALGFMFGDGWITHHPNSKGSMRWVTCFAKGVEEELNQKVLSYFENKFDFKFKETKFGYYRTEVARVGKFLERMGFKGKAKTKRIPEYIFRSFLKCRLEFIKGFLDADGYNDGKRLSIEICNKDLIKDFKLLCEISGYKVSNIYHRTRLSHPPKSPNPILSHSYHISMGLKPNCPCFRKVKIMSIKPKGVKEVYDLTVSHTHNFIAEGLVVHNTRWHFGDLYGKIIAEGDIFKVFHRDSGRTKGKLIFADIGLTKEFLDLQWRQQGSYLASCLYENNPVPEDAAIFKATNFSFYGSIKPIDLYFTGTLDPAGEGRDKTGLTVVGTDNELTMHVCEAIQKTMTPTEMIDEIIRLNYKYKFKSFGLETIFFRKMLKLELERRLMEEHRVSPGKFPLFHVEEFGSSSRHGKSKFARIMALQPYHERGAIKFPGEKLELLKDGFGQLAHQMIQFTPTHMPEPNDVLDALADHIPLVRRGGIAKAKEPPRNSAAWLEKRWIDQAQERNRFIPRRLRREIPMPSLS